MMIGIYTAKVRENNGMADFLHHFMSLSIEIWSRLFLEENT